MPTTISVNCADCGEDIEPFEPNYCEYHDLHYCEPCYEGHAECDDERRDNGLREQRVNEKSTRYIGAQRGTIVQSLRPFGVEIECLINDAHSLRHNLPKDVGVTGDGSLSDNGVEIQTPPVAGFAGEQLIKKVTRTLADYEARIDRSCGLHVHLDTKEFTPTNWQTLQAVWILYLTFEDVLFSFLPRSRRNNGFAIAIRDHYHLKEIREANSRKELEGIWYRVQHASKLYERKKVKYDRSRYAGLNLHSLFSSRHVEIRYHAGTTNARKILEWANLHALMFDAATKSRNITNSAHNEVDLKRKTTMLFDLLRLPQPSRDYFRERQRMFTSNRDES